MAQALDPFRVTDKLDATALGVMATRLEARGTHPQFVQQLAAYLDRMRIDERSAVLDLGCGTGIAARAIARRPNFKGSILGIDLGPGLIDTAHRLAAAEGLGGRVRFETGDAHTLRFRSAAFDAVVAHTLFSHLADPAKTLAEIRRVLRPGGGIAIFDGDYASLTFELDDEARSRRMDDAVTASLVTNPRIMRRLPRLFRQEGIVIETVLPSIIAEVGMAEFWKSGIDAYAKLVPRAGILSQDEASAWCNELLGASARGEFFGSCVYYAYVARVT